jgi:L-threonylcarbamoyladenylate synthase
VDPADLEQAAAVIRSGGLVAYPTEAVFGLGCDPRDQDAVMRLLALKERDVRAGLILIAAELDLLAEFIQPFDAAQSARILPTWPGPVTWVVAAAAATPAWIRGDHSTVAVRVTAHPLAAALCRAAGTALVSTSANLHGAAPARSARDLQIALGARVDHVVAGSCGEQDRPTEIRDATTGAVLRKG